MKQKYFIVKKRISFVKNKTIFNSKLPHDVTIFKPVVLGIKGAAGLGKTRLVREFLKSRIKYSLSGQSESFVQSPYSSYISIIKSYCKITQSDSNDIIKGKIKYSYSDISNYLENKSLKKKLFEGLNLIYYLFGIKSKDSRLTLQGSDLRLQIQIAIRKYIEAIAAKSNFNREPLLIVMEDVHWIDEASRNTFLFILNTLNTENNYEQFSSRQILFILLYRPEFKPGYELENVSDFSEIELASLDNISVEKLFKQVPDKKDPGKDAIAILPEDYLKDLSLRSEGNPLFIQEWSKLIRYRYLKSELEVDTKGNIVLSKSKLEIPETINSLIKFRFDNLDDSVKEILQTASVVGIKFSSKQIESINRSFGKDILSIQDILNHLEENKFIRKSGESADLYKFIHSILQEAVYKTIPDENKKLLHIAAAEAIENLYAENIYRYYYLLAEHYDKSGSVEKAIEYFEKAGDKARDSFENDVALEYYEKFLSHNVIDFAKTYKIHLKKLNLLKHTGKWDDAILFCEKLTADNVIKKKKECYFEITLILAEIYHLKGEYKKSKEIISKILKLREVISNSNLLDQIYGLSGKNYLFEGNLKKAEIHLNLFYKNSLNNSDSLNRAKALNNLGILNRMQGKYEEALKYYNNSKSLYEQLGNIIEANHIISNIGNLYFFLNDYFKAIEFFKKAVELNFKTGSLNAYANSLGNLGNAFMHIGDKKSAKKYLLKKLNISKQLNNKDGIASSCISLGNYYLDEGLYSEALEYYLKSLVLFEEMNKKSSIANVKYNIALINYFKGNFGESLKYYSEQLEIYIELSDKEGLQRSYLNLGNLHNKLKNTGIAENYYKKAIELSKQSGAKRMYAISMFNYAEYLFDLKNFAEAEKTNSEALGICNKNKYENELLQVKLLNEKIMFYEEFEKINLDMKKDLHNFELLKKIIGRTEMLLSDSSSDNDIALVNFEIWKMKNSIKETNPKGISQNRKQALILYEKLIKQTPNIEYQSNILELQNNI